MPITLTNVDYSPLHHEVELEISDEDELAQHVAYLILGNHLHVQLVLAAKLHKKPKSNDRAIECAIPKLSYITEEQRYKRDGWIYQMINWIAINKENIGLKFHVQLPHDAPAQHGIDGVAVLLKSNNNLEQLIISEDKCTENPRSKIRREVWPEFEEFEKGTYDHQLVGRISYLLHHLSSNTLLNSINDDIYRTEIRKYRTAITPVNNDKKALKRPKLFKGYDKAIKGADSTRRNSLTFYQGDIRQWMDDFCPKVIAYLQTLKSTHV